MSTQMRSSFFRWLRQCLPLAFLGIVLWSGWLGHAKAMRSSSPSSWSARWEQSIQPTLRQAGRSLTKAKPFAPTVNFTVTKLDDDGSTGTLRWAITQANSTAGANTVDFQVGLTGTITLTTAQGGTLTLTDTTGATTIQGPTSGGGITVSGNNLVRVFQINGGVTASLNNLTITGGSVGHLQSGAGINSLGHVTVKQCLVTGNKTTGESSGGGISVSGSNASLTLLNSTVSSNSSKYGPGIFNNSMPFTFINSTISDNTGEFNGNGAFYNRYGTGTIIGCTFSGNRSYVTGGLTNEGDITIINSTFSGNRADIPGTFAGNGGGLINQGPAMRLYNCTVTGNVGSVGGGIQTQDGAHFVMKNTIVAGNVSTFGGNTPYDLEKTGNDGYNDSVLGASTNNLIGSTTKSGGLTNGVNGNIVGNNGVGTLPLANILTTPLANNGGPTLTFALASNSPAQNAGGNLTTLNGAVNDSTTTLTLANAGAFPAGANLVIQIDSEQMLVTGRTGNQLTVTRAVNSTTAAAHSSGAGVNPAFDQRGAGFARVNSPAVDIGAVEMAAATPPTFTNCPTNQTVNAASNACTAAVSFSPAAMGSPAPAITCKIGATTITSPYNFPVGTSNVVCTASNGSAPDATCSFTVTVNDTQPPTIAACPGTQTVTATASTGATVTYTPPTASDNCGAAPVVCNPPSGATFALGTTPVNCVATDAGGRTSSCSFNVVVNCPTVTVNPANPSLPAGTIGTPYSASFTQSGLVGGAVSFSKSAGTLPSGLTLTSNGSLTGTPTQGGTFNFTVSANDALLCGGSRAYSLTINCPTITLATPTGTAAIGVSYNSSAAASPSLSGLNYQYSLANSTTLPPGLALNPSSGAITGLPSSAGSFTFTIKAELFNGATSIGCSGSQSYTIVVSCPTVTLAPLSPTSVAFNTALAQTITAAPAGGNYSFAVTGGMLPPGLTLNSNGSFNGAPTQSGTFNFRVTATGFGSCTGFSDYTLQVLCPTISMSPVSLPGGGIGTAYNASITANPAGMYSYSVTSGSLPAGLSLNPMTGAITGMPTTNGLSIFAVTATANGCTGSQTYTITIGCGSLTPSTLPNAQAGVAYNQTISVTPAGSYTYSLLMGSLPPGMMLNTATGALTGTATATGTYTFTLQASSTSGCTNTQTYALVVSCPTITLNPATATLSGGTVGTAYSQTLSATPSGSYSFSKTSGTLPPGVTLSATGLLSGTPTTSGTYAFSVTATGFGTCTGSQSYSLTVTASCAAITLPALPTTGTVGVAYSGSLAGTTPSGSYTYSVDSGTLPPGLAINNLFGTLSGNPTAANTYTFTLKATRSNGCTGTRLYTVTVSGPAMVARARTADYDGDGKSDLTLWSQATGRWQILRSSDEQTQTPLWGGAGDVTLLGDYDGDGRTDIAVFRPGNGTWFVKQSSDGAAFIKAWGAATDVPVPGDYDGDGKTDVAVWRPSEGNWYVLKSSDGSYSINAWGLGVAPYLDVPVPGDYDGDGKTDLAVIRRQTGAWVIKKSSDGRYTTKVWGGATDVPVAGDYDGDGKTDLAVWRGATGEWLVLRSSDQTYTVNVWGAADAGDVPALGDYDGDGQTDIAVWRGPEQTWYVQGSRAGALTRTLRGQAGDRPVSGR